jgi:putative glutamine transport system substrate-binding protein
MKKILLGFILMFTAFCFAGCSNKAENAPDALSQVLQRGKLVVGVKYDTKPFGYLNDKQQLIGFDVDLARYIAKCILGDENKVEFKQVTPSNRILALNSGQVDMIVATMTITPQRQEVVDFSRPYYFTGQTILVPAGSKVTSMSDLNGKKVIVVFGSTAEKVVRLKAPDADIIGFKTYTSGYSALKEGRADAMTSDDTILLGFAMQDKGLKLLPTKYSKEPYAIAFKKGPTSKSLRDKVDFILSDMQSSGKLNQLKKKWVNY